MAHQDGMTRRSFLKKTALASAGAWVLPRLAVAQAPPKTAGTATDLVPLGQSAIKVSRLGFGTGSNGGRVQRELGQEKFADLIRYAVERGVTFIDTADNYSGMHEMIRPAINGLDREKIQIQCKIPHGKYDDPLAEIDRFRKEVGTDYFDTLLIHCVEQADWVEQEKRLRDLLDEAKEKQMIRAAGVSMHGLPSFRATVAAEWGDVRLVRINHNGAYMDSLKSDWKDTGDVQAVVDGLRAMHAAGKGIIGMKLIGNGDFTDSEVRRQSIEFVMGLACVDAVVIGFKSPQEIDEAITNINSGLAKRLEYERGRA